MKNDFILQLFRFSKKGFAFHIKKILIPIKDSYTNVADKAIISTKIKNIFIIIMQRDIFTILVVIA
jgi:hypothetical protein